MNGTPTLLRSYNSRREAPPEFNCTIWQAGRATSSIALMFKPIQIGQLVFHDEGAGRFNPAPEILDEARSEWPSREIGVFVSIGTGKRPTGSNKSPHLWWEGFAEDFAEARRRLIEKIEGCEETHQYMLKEYLSKRNVNPENYYRFNVEELAAFGMNEWTRLADISTNTHRYLSKREIQSSITTAASKMAKIHNAHTRMGRHVSSMEFEEGDEQNFQAHPLAVELPGAEIDMSYHQPYRPSSQPRQQPPLPPAKTPPPNVNLYGPASRESEAPQVISPVDPRQPPPLPRRSNELSPGVRRSNEHSWADRSSIGSFVPSPRRSSEYPDAARPSVSSSMSPSPWSNQTVPPRPPKTPLPYPDMELNTNEPRASSLPSTAPNRPPQPPPRVLNGNAILPYPDGPAPSPNLARKPEFRPR